MPLCAEIQPDRPQSNNDRSPNPVCEPADELPQLNGTRCSAGFVSLAAILLAPALHRMLHKLHLEETKDAQ